MNTPYLANTTAYPFSLEVDRSEGIYIIDKKGKKYYDLIAGISVSNLGHQHPAIVKRVKDQIDKHMHVMVYGEYSQSVQNVSRLSRSEYLTYDNYVQYDNE